MKIRIGATGRWLRGALCAGAISSVAACVQGQTLFVTDFGASNGVYEVTTSGARSNFVSGLTAPDALAFDSAGDLFVGDGGSSNIYVFTNHNGALSAKPAILASKLNVPWGLAFDGKGDLFESDFNSGDIYEFTNHNGALSTNRTRFASGLNGPVGLAFDAAGDLFEADFNTGTIYEFTNQNGTLNSRHGRFAAGLNQPGGLAFNRAGVLYVADDVTNTGNVVKVAANGAQTLVATNLDFPLGLAFDSNSNLFIANQSGYAVVEVTPGGAESNFFIGPVGDKPSGVAFAPPSPALQAAVTNRVYHLNVAGMPSPYYSTYAVFIEASTNLANWGAVYTNTPPFTFTDTLTLPRRFYRAGRGP